MLYVSLVIAMAIVKTSELVAGPCMDILTDLTEMYTVHIFLTLVCLSLLYNLLI